MNKTFCSLLLVMVSLFILLPHCNLTASNWTPLKILSVSEKRELAYQTKRKKEIDLAVAAAAPLYKAYGCEEGLAYTTGVYAVDYKLPARLLAAVIVVESSCHANAVSKAGAVGYMQILPRTVHLSQLSLLDKTTNIDKGSQYLSQLIKVYGVHLALEHYYGISPGSKFYADKVIGVSKGIK